jgi:hypothetical protein
MSMVKNSFYSFCSLFLIVVFVACKKGGPAEHAGEKLDEAGRGPV